MTDNFQSPAAELFHVEQQNFHQQYQSYFKMKRENFFRAISMFNGLWECFQVLNDIWHKEIEDVANLRDKHQMLPSLIFRYAHSRFVVAMELGFSCCIGDAYSVLRGGIEAVAQAHKIHREPRLTEVWVEKEKGKIEQARFRQEFEAHKETSLFPAQHGLAKLFTYWKQFSNFGPHSGVLSVGKGFEEIVAASSVSWVFHYFESDEQKLALYLFALLDASYHMERAFYDCFESRFQFDLDLDSLRKKFVEQREQQRQFLWTTYKLS